MPLDQLDQLDQFDQFDQFGQFAPFVRLPVEIQYQVLEHCSARTLVTVMRADKRTNALVKDVLATRMSRLCGLSASQQQENNLTAKDSDYNRLPPNKRPRILLRAHSPEDLSPESSNWFELEYAESNAQGYAFTREYGSEPSSAYNSDHEDDDDDKDDDKDVAMADTDSEGSDTDMKASTPQRSSTHSHTNSHSHSHSHSPHRNSLLAKLFSSFHHYDNDLIAQSKLTLKAHIKTAATGMSIHSTATAYTAANPSHPSFWLTQHSYHGSPSPSVASAHNPKHVASLDVVKGDTFGQVILQLSFSNPSPHNILQKTLRIYTDWTGEPEYLVHNRELSARVHVVKRKDVAGGEPMRNDFGEEYERFDVFVEELVVNTAYMLSKLENRDRDNFFVKRN